MEKQDRRSALKKISATATGLAILKLSFAKENMTENLPFIIRAMESKKEYNLWGRSVYLKVGAADSNKQLSMFYGTYQKGDGPPLHIHHDQDEQFYVLEGEFLIQVGNDKYTLMPGDTAYLPKNIPHTYLVLSDAAKMVFQTQPSGKIEELFQYLADNYETKTIEEIGKAMPQFNHSWIGPPLSVK
jgi:quercetin 2,3-dioxygenase